MPKSYLEEILEIRDQVLCQLQEKFCLTEKGKEKLSSMLFTPESCSQAYKKLPEAAQFFPELKTDGLYLMIFFQYGSELCKRKLQGFTILSQENPHGQQGKKDTPVGERQTFQNVF